MHEITTHHDGHGLNEGCIITAGERGPGGSAHEYTVVIDQPHGQRVRPLHIQFQCGPRFEEGSRTGVVSAAIYAIMIDHLEGFQSGPYPHPETQKQVDLLKECLASAKRRADERAARGVLGTYQK